MQAGAQAGSQARVPQCAQAGKNIFLTSNLINFINSIQSSFTQIISGPQARVQECSKTRMYQDPQAGP